MLGNYLYVTIVILCSRLFSEFAVLFEFEFEFVV